MPVCVMFKCMYLHCLVHIPAREGVRVEWCWIFSRGEWRRLTLSTEKEGLGWLVLARPLLIGFRWNVSGLPTLYFRLDAPGISPRSLFPTQRPTRAHLRYVHGEPEVNISCVSNRDILCRTTQKSIMRTNIFYRGTGGWRAQALTKASYTWAKIVHIWFKIVTFP